MEPLVVLSDVKSLRQIRRYMEQAVLSANLDSGTAYRLMLAVEELASNIIEHGYGPDNQGKWIKVEAIQNHENLVVVLEDQSPPYNLSEATMPDTQAPLENRRKGGYGNLLVLNNVDAFEYEREGTINRNKLIINLNGEKNSPPPVNTSHSVNRDLTEHLQSEYWRMKTELDITRRLQKLIMPRNEDIISLKGLEMSSYTGSAYEVGGDYFDVVSLPGKIRIGIGDVTGHGLDSGIVMLMLQAAVRTSLNNPAASLSECLNAVNRSIYENIQRMQSDKLATLMLLEYSGERLSLVGQHEHMIVGRTNGVVEIIDTVDLGLPLGLMDDISACVAQMNLPLNHGDIVVLYTDGITEATNTLGKLYGLERLGEVVRLNTGNTPSQVKMAIMADLYDHMGGADGITDDITLVVFKRSVEKLETDNSLQEQHRIFGDFDNNGEYTQQLQINFHPSTYPLTWATCGFTANYAAEILGQGFPPGKLRQDITGSVSYIANELMENALKFHYDKFSEINFIVRQVANEIELIVSNSVSPDSMPKFRAFIEELSTSDPQELFIRHLETGLDSLGESSSGLGFLTIMNDYGGRLGWKFEISEGTPENIIVYTMARYPIPKELIPMQIKSDLYSVEFQEEQQTVVFKGTFRINTSSPGEAESYNSILNLLNAAADTRPSLLTLDLRQLDFLNSSGINVLLKFVIAIRQRGGMGLKVLGSKEISWQGKSLPNLQKLMPSLELVME